MSARVVPLAEVDDALIERWQSLGREALEPNPFAEAEFVLAAERGMGSGGHTALVAVERDGELRFALPVIRRHHVRRIPVPAAATWHHAYSFLGTPLVSPHDPVDSWGEALTAMRRLAPWAALEQLGGDGTVASSLTAAQAGLGRSLTELGRRDRPVVRRRADGRYLDALSSNRRSKVRRLRPRLGADHDGEVRVVDHAVQGADLEQAIDDFLAMEARGWKGADGGAMARRAGHGEFFREMCRRFAARQSLQMRALQVGHTTIAYQCNLIAGDTLFGFKTTYDEAYRRHSPGVVLVLDTIDAFHANGALEVYDSCMGPDPSTLRDLFPDHRRLVDALASLHGLLGQAATRGAPHVADAYRRAGLVMRSWESRFRSRPGAGSRSS